MKRLSLTLIVICIFTANSCAEESIPFVEVPGGTFTRGVEGGTGYPNYDEVLFGADNPLDEVTVSAFRMSKYEIPFRLYREFAENHWKEYGLTELSWTNEEVRASAGIDDPSFEIPENWPAFHVGYFDAIEFANWLSRLDGFEPVYSVEEVRRQTADGESVYLTLDIEWNVDADGYRLPTEAEWEYAARAGNRDDDVVLSQVPDVVERIGWYADNSGGRLHEIGLKEPNSFGIHDMVGNVHEWTWDFYQPDYYPRSSDIDPRGPDVGAGDRIEYAPERTRVWRGGAVRTPIDLTPPYYRGPSSPNTRPLGGIRLVRNAD